MINNVRERIVHRRLCYVRDRCRCCRRDRHLITVVQSRYRCGCSLCYGYRVRLFAKRYCVLVLRVRQSVIFVAVVRRYDLQFRLVLRDLQRADRLCNRVVAPYCRRALARAFLARKYDRVAVRFFADFRDRSRHSEVCRLTVLVARYCTRRRQCFTVVFAARAFRYDRQRRRRNAQLARSRVADRVVLRHVFVAAHDLDRCVLEAAVVIGRSYNMRTGRGNISGDRQNVAFSKTGDGIRFFVDITARASDFANRVAGLFGAVIGDSLILHRNRQGRGRHRQGAEFFLYSIVVRVDLAPNDFVGVVALFSANRRLRTSDFDRDRVAGCERNLIVADIEGILGRRLIDGKRQRTACRQRRAVVLLARAAGGDRDLCRDDLQTAGTDRQTDAVVAVTVRQISRSQREIIIVVADILLIFHIILHACRAARLDVVQPHDQRSNIVEICFGIPFVADHDVLIPSRLGRVREAGQIRFAGIRCAGPAVGLDTNRNVDLGDVIRAADVADRIVVHCMIARHDRVLRRNRCRARVQTAVFNITVREAEFNGLQIADRKILSFDLDLTVQFRGQRQRRAVILLRIADRRDGDLLLIEQREGQTVRRHVFRNLIGRACRISAVFGTDNRLVQFPTVDRVARKRKGLADLQVLHILRRDRVAVHINKVDRDGCVLEARIGEHQFIRAGAENQFLLNRIREELDAFQFGMLFIERGVIDRRSQFLNGRRIAVDILNDLCRSYFDPRIVFQHILDRIADVFRFLSVNEDDLIGARIGQRDRLAALIRTVARDRKRVLGDDLILLEVRVGHYLVRRKRNISLAVDGDGRGFIRTCFTQIAHGVAQRRAGPMRIDRGVRLDLRSPVEELIAVRRGVPAVERVAGL